LLLESRGLFRRGGDTLLPIGLDGILEESFLNNTAGTLASTNPVQSPFITASSSIARS
jgi:hypothetical protein